MDKPENWWNQQMLLNFILLREWTWSKNTSQQYTPIYCLYLTHTHILPQIENSAHVSSLPYLMDPVISHPVLPTPRFTRLIGLLWNPLPGFKKLLAGGLKLGYFSFVCPRQLFFLQICQFPVNSESFWASSMSKNILFINFRD